MEFWNFVYAFIIGFFGFVLIPIFIQQCVKFATTGFYIGRLRFSEYYNRNYERKKHGNCESKAGKEKSVLSEAEGDGARNGGPPVHTNA